MWEEIEKAKAKQRMLSGGYPVVNGTEGQNEKGRSRDIIAQKVDIGSGRVI